VNCRPRTTRLHAEQRHQRKVGSASSAGGDRDGDIASGSIASAQPVSTCQVFDHQLRRRLLLAKSVMSDIARSSAVDTSLTVVVKLIDEERERAFPALLQVEIGRRRFIQLRFWLERRSALVA
jgi:hypothetical protein